MEGTIKPSVELLCLRIMQFKEMWWIIWIHHFLYLIKDQGFFILQSFIHSTIDIIFLLHDIGYRLKTYD